MPAISSTLVIGGGLAGTAAAISLAQAGVAVDLVEVRPEPAVQGSGITLQGNALRVLRDLGIWEQVSSQGYGYDSMGIRAPGPQGQLVAEIPDVRTGGPDLPATLGMNRPDLARLLLERAVEVGVKISLATTATLVVADESGVDVTLTDGSTARYDLVVAADGVRSPTRSMLGVQLTTRPLGMGIWRVHLPRTPEVFRTELTYGGRCFIAGYCPTSEDTLYAYLVEEATDRSGLDQTEQVAVFRDLATSYHGPWDALRESLSDTTPINYTWFETHFLEGPWNRGRVVFIGDAVHACPPTIAQGGAMALEDGAVLADVLASADHLDDDVWAQFTARRSDRVRRVVDASVQVTDWTLNHVQADVAGLMHDVLSSLTEQP